MDFVALRMKRFSRGAKANDGLIQRIKGPRS